MAITKVYIVYYSMYGHVQKLAEEIKKGAASVEGVEAQLWQVPETLPEEALGKMSAPPIITADELPEADGFVFGFPTRFGMMASQFKAFFIPPVAFGEPNSSLASQPGSSTALDLKVVVKKLQLL